MKIAVVGGGVSGIVAAHALHERHEITLFESGGYLGGHTNTVSVEREDGPPLAIDTGFIVLNDRNYAHFSELLATAGVAVQPTHMGFSVKGEDADFEYAGTPAGLFAQRSNLARPQFWRMIKDLHEFNRSLVKLLVEDGDEDRSLRTFVDQGGYSRWFIERLIVPQASAVWSADPAGMWDFPVRFLAEFFQNHGMLGFRDRPRWQTVVGGSKRYVEALSAPFRDRVRLNAPVELIRRHPGHVEVRPRGGEVEDFDLAVIACHADQALAALADPTASEREVLGAFTYSRNEAVLHTDARLLPRRRRVRQAWNFHLFEEPRPLTTVTYYMNHLQRLNCAADYCVSLNMTDRIDPSKVIRRIDYTHPIYTRASVAAQSRWSEISGVGRTRYAGAHWGSGFHEDGVVSGLRAVKGL
ncbi:MAG TPA: FAD-dependent oxidoreductase [Solirubrobacteraceae bacterium]|nr:FAD-dependent oxidoreductase [Solirubrobacteraceae bacterium]